MLGFYVTIHQIITLLFYIIINVHDKRWEHWEKINLVDNEKNDKELHKEVQGKSNLPASLFSSSAQKTQIVTQYSAAASQFAEHAAVL